MEIQKFDIEGPLLIRLKTHHDDRGFFVERFNLKKFEELGLPSKFVQDNYSRSHFGVLRGLHLQIDPPQGKLVSCTQGAILDVAVDVRNGSKTFGQHISVSLSGDAPALFWIPAGFAHGFCVTSAGGADVSYKVDNLWSPGAEKCIKWDSPNLKISWPIPSPAVSDKDSRGINFDDYT